jgi:O-antigen/teichoic acid export membrane protein
MYSRGYGVVNLFRTNIGGAIGSVAFPAFAREHREKGTAPQLFLKSRVYLTGISWPFFSAGIILAFPIIRVLFGNQWDAAVPLMRWLCAAAIIDTLTYQCDVFLVAIGRVRTATRIAVQFQLARAALTIMAAFVSLVAVAAVQVLVYVIGTALYYRELGDFDALSIRSCIKSLIPSVTVTLATCVVPTIVVLWPGFVHGHMVLAFGVAVIGGCIGWLAAVLIIPHPLADELRHLASRFPRLRRMLYG